MRPEDHLGEPKTLRNWLASIGQFPGDGWLYIREDAGSLSLDTVCWPDVMSGTDLSEEEWAEFEVWAKQNGFKEFLNEDLLEDIVINLRMQDQHFTDDQLINAINYYWKYDAFMDLNNS